MDKIVFIDLETGGLRFYPEQVGDKILPMNPIIQIACAVVDCDQGKIVDTFEQKVKFDEKECTKEALIINGYQEGVWKTAMTKAVSREKLTTFLKRHATVEKISRGNSPYRVALLGGHNVSAFDYPFIHAWYGDCFLPADYHTIDTMTLGMVYSRMTGVKFPNLKQFTLAEYFKIPNVKEHDALADVTQCAQLYLAMMADLKGRMCQPTSGKGRVVPVDTVFVPTVTVNSGGQTKGVSVKL